MVEAKWTMRLDGRSGVDCEGRWCRQSWSAQAEWMLRVGGAGGVGVRKRSGF